MMVPGKLVTAAEQHLVDTLPAEKGRDLLKQVRSHLIESAKPLVQAMVQEITGVQVVSLHHDISTVTGEAFVVLTLAEPPAYRQAKKSSRCSPWRWRTPGTPGRGVGRLVAISRATAVGDVRPRSCSLWDRTTILSSFQIQWLRRVPRRILRDS
jgi:hypothetical protein